MLGFIVMMFARAQSAGERIYDILDAESAVQEKPDPIDLKDLEGHVWSFGTYDPWADESS